MGDLVCRILSVCDNLSCFSFEQASFLLVRVLGGRRWRMCPGNMCAIIAGLCVDLGTIE